MLSQQCVPVCLSGRALCQQRKRLWVRFPGITHTNVHPHLSWFTVASIIRTFRLENRYVFNSPLQTVSTVFTVRYHITLLYHMYCIASWLVLLLKLKIVVLWNTQYSSTIEMLQYSIQYVYCTGRAELS